MDTQNFVLKKYFDYKKITKKIQFIHGQQSGFVHKSTSDNFGIFLSVSFHKQSKLNTALKGFSFVVLHSNNHFRSRPDTLTTGSSNGHN